MTTVSLDNVRWYHRITAKLVVLGQLHSYTRFKEYAVLAKCTLLTAIVIPLCTKNPVAN